VNLIGQNQLGKKINPTFTNRSKFNFSFNFRFLITNVLNLHALPLRKIILIIIFLEWVTNIDTKTKRNFPRIRIMMNKL